MEIYLELTLTNQVRFRNLIFLTVYLLKTVEISPVQKLQLITKFKEDYEETLYLVCKYSSSLLLYLIEFWHSLLLHLFEDITNFNPV